MQTAFCELLVTRAENLWMQRVRQQSGQPLKQKMREENTLQVE
jgi:hypothetical protein